MSTFDYVEYNEKSKSLQGMFKGMVTLVETHLKEDLKPGRARSLALTKLEECYMWIGKAIRDEQLGIDT